MSAAKVTIDHDEIRRWVEARGGCPARVKRTARGNGSGILRIDYTGFSGVDSLEPMSWDDWFQAFDKNELAFLYQDGVGSRKGTSRFSKLVDRSGTARRARTGATARRAGRTTKQRSGQKAKSRSTAARTTKASSRSKARPATKKAGASGTGRARSTTKTTRKAGRAGSTGRTKRSTAGKPARVKRASTGRRGSSIRLGPGEEVKIVGAKRSTPRRTATS